MATRWHGAYSESLVRFSRPEFQDFTEFLVVDEPCLCDVNTLKPLRGGSKDVTNYTIHNISLDYGSRITRLYHMRVLQFVVVPPFEVHNWGSSGIACSLGVMPLWVGEPYQCRIKYLTTDPGSCFVLQICMEKRREMLYFPCSHLLVCSHCTDQIQASVNPSCPTCGAIIDSAINVC